MKQWVKKLLTQFDNESASKDPHSASAHKNSGDEHAPDLSEDRATLLYIIDTYSKNLIEIDTRPVRKVREIFDEFAKGLLKPIGPHTDKILFRFRQFFAAYRIQEYTYLQKTFEDFKGIIWDFADQLNESVISEQARDTQVRESLEELREAVEANSIDELKAKSREFIDFYIEIQNKNDQKRMQRLESVQKNLESVKQKLVEVNQTARRDHLTGAYNRKSFDEMLAKACDQLKQKSMSSILVILDIDYFKKINDIFGHDAGDFVLKHLSKLMQEHFNTDEEFVARIGGEEFAVMFSGIHLPEVVGKLESFLAKIRKEVIVHSDAQIRMTLSAGLALLGSDEPAEKWYKRADTALYNSKNTGRDKYTIAQPASGSMRVA